MKVWKGTGSLPQLRSRQRSGTLFQSSEPSKSQYRIATADWRTNTGSLAMSEFSAHKAVVLLARFRPRNLKMGILNMVFSPF